MLLSPPQLSSETVRSRSVSLLDQIRLWGKRFELVDKNVHRDPRLGSSRNEKRCVTTQTLRDDPHNGCEGDLVVMVVAWCHMWVCLLLVLVLVHRVFLPVLWFPSHHKNQHSTRIEDQHENQLRLLWLPLSYCNIFFSSSYYRFRTGTNLQLRLMPRVFKCKRHSSLFNDIPTPHMRPLLQASSSPIPRIGWHCHAIQQNSLGTETTSLSIQWIKSRNCKVTGDW